MLNVPNEALRVHLPAAGGGEAEATAVWALGASGTLDRRAVRLGLKGDTVTEILDGELKTGEAVAVRVKSTAERRRP